MFLLAVGRRLAGVQRLHLRPEGLDLLLQLAFRRIDSVSSAWILSTAWIRSVRLPPFLWAACSDFGAWPSLPNW